MQFGRNNFEVDVPKTLGQNSNSPQDSGIKRRNGDFANPNSKGNVRPVLVEEEVQPDHIPKAVRKRQAAIKDPVMAIRPDVRAFSVGDGEVMWMPVEPDYKPMKSPVFLVDPRFTKKMAPKEKVLFEGNDYGGHHQPLVGSVWPIIGSQVQDFFGVGASCSSGENQKKIIYREPEYRQMQLPSNYFPVQEPLYENPNHYTPR